MATDLFGFQAGRRMADIDSAALRKAALDERAAELEIKKGETELAQNEAFLDAIAGGELQARATSEEDVPDVLEQLGMIGLKTGNLEKGKELLTASSTIANQRSLMARREAKTLYENLSTLSNLYSEVESPKDWQMANEQFQLLTGQPSPYAGVPYSRELVEQARTATTTEKDRAAIALAETRRTLVEEQTREAQRRQELILAQEEYTRERTKNLEKAGVKPVPAAYLNAVKNKLQDEFDDINTSPGQLGNIALPLAEQVYEKVRTEGLSMSQAVDAVVQEAIDNGDLGGWTPMTAFRAGDHRDRPLEVPRAKDGKVDATKLKKNKYYIIPGTGQVVLYTNAGKFLAIDPAEEEEELEDEDADLDEELE